jgi:mycoredoxin
MLKIYAAKWCPHCTKTVEYLKNNHIEFEYFEIARSLGSDRDNLL